MWNMFKGNYKNTRKRHWRRSGVFIVNFEHISDLFLVFLLLTLNKQMLASLWWTFFDKHSYGVITVNRFRFTDVL